MKYILILLSIFISFYSYSQTANLPVYRIEKRTSHPILEKQFSGKINKDKTQDLFLRFKIKKFRITRTANGPKVTFEDVCQQDAKTSVINLVGGGLVQEEVFGVCKSKWMDKEVLIILSGMVYDTESSDFSDETDELRRNFFSHLSIEAGNYIFGLGDFNLDYTTQINFGHLASHLSIDPKYTPLTKVNYREGFTASIRYRE